MKTTRLKVTQQGDMKVTSEFGYGLVGNDDAVCFWIDVAPRGFTESSSSNDDDCPMVWIGCYRNDDLLQVEFIDYPGWRFHAGGSGKSIAIALVRKGAD